MEHLDLNTIWFVLVGVLLAGYAILDGFDLGVGMLHLLTKEDMDRRRMINSIGPVWDGNEVWLVTGGGALFAAFPEVYATVFSGFYMLFVLFLVGIIFRAVAIEFRSKRPGTIWRRSWDVAFSVGSFIPSFLMGVMVGNMICGIPLDGDFEYQGTLMMLFRPYPILIGFLTMALFLMHGSIYVYLKTEGELQEKAKKWVGESSLLFMVIYLFTNYVTFTQINHVESVIGKRPHITLILMLNILIVLFLYIFVKKGKEFLAFLASCFSMITMMALFASTMYPYMVYSVPHLENSLTVYNAASTSKTLSIMLLIAAIGVPLVLTYTVSVYWIFRGKVHVNEDSY